MAELEPSGVQHQTSRRFVAIESIAGNLSAHRSDLDADLVGSPCLRKELEQRARARPLEHAVTRDRLLGIRLLDATARIARGRRRHHLHAAPLAGDEGVRENALLELARPSYDA